MNDNYSTISYLTLTDLNNIEDKVEELTNDIQDNIFENETSSLRNIQVGDNLNNKTLYLFFPRDSYENITNTTRIDIISIDNNTRIAYLYNTNKRYIYVRYNGTSYYLYAKNDSAYDPYLNYVRVKLPFDMGTVTSIDDTDQFYQYIKIYEDEDIIPNYQKHVYTNNETPTMQNIDNLEQGIKNIGYYFYKPNGWQTSREWLGTAIIGKTTRYGVNIQNISYEDLNRWINNLNLINFNTLDKLNIWNTNIVHVIWDTPYEQEWEEL